MVQKISKSRAPGKSTRRLIKSPAKTGSIKFREIERAVREVARRRTEARESRSDYLDARVEKFESKRTNITELHGKLAGSELSSKGEFVPQVFGKPARYERNAREGLNPATGEVLKVRAETPSRFRTSKAMKGSVLGKK